MNRIVLYLFGLCLLGTSLMAQQHPQADNRLFTAQSLRQEAGTVLWKGRINSLHSTQAATGLVLESGAIKAPLAFTSLAFAWEAAAGLQPSSFTLRYRVHRPGKGWGEWNEEEGAYAPSETALNAYATDLLFGLDEGQHDSLSFSLEAPYGQNIGQVYLVFQDMSGHEQPKSIPQPPVQPDQSSACPPQPTLVARSAWCGSFNNCHNPTYTPAYITPSHTVIHHGASPNSYTDGHAVVRSYWNYHVNTLGWSDIGYNYLFDRFGNSFVGRHNPNFPNQEVRGAHAGNSNSASIGLSFLGNAELAANVPTIALNRCTDFLAWWFNRRGLNPTTSANIINQPGTQTLNLPRVCGHRDLNATACPGTILYNYLPTFRSSALQIIQNCTTATVAPPTLSAAPACQTGSITLTVTVSASQTFQLCNSSGTVLQSWTGTATSRTFTGLANGTYAGRVVRNGTTSALSGTVTLSNHPASVGGTVSGGTASICQGSATGTLSLSGHTGSVIRWERRLNGGTWTNISHTATTYSETPSSAGTWDYRAVVRSGTCVEALSSTRTISVKASSLGGSIAVRSSSICLNQSTGAMLLSGHRGSVLRWERRFNGGTWTNIAHTSTSYHEIPTASGTWEYRALLQNSPCTSVYSAIRSITVGTRPLGSNCTCPLNVVLPLINHQDHTSNYGNDFRPNHVSPNFSGLEANDAVFSFSVNQTSLLTATLQVSGIWGAMTLLRQCPNATTPPTPVATFAQWNGGQLNVTVDPGSYFLIVSSTSIWTQSMPFTLSIQTSAIVSQGSTTLTKSMANLLLFPNPAQDVLNVQADKSLSNLRIFNLQGALMYQSEQIHTDRFTCPLGDLPAGMYFLQAWDEEGEMQSQNFVIQR